MKLKKLTAIIMAALIIASATGCKKSDNSSETKDVQYLDVSEMFTDRDKKTDYNEADCINIKLNGSSAECSSKNVSISKGTVTIKKEGIYMLSGKLSDGMIIIDADKKDKIQLVLNGADITKSTSAAIYVKKADKVFVTLADGSENTLANSSDFEAIDDNNIDGVIFSKSDITFNGKGSLTINAVYGHGIVCKDDAVFTGGQYNITTAKKGINANDSIRIADGSFTITSGTDALHSENSDNEQLGYIYIADGSFTLDSGTDAIDSSSIAMIDGGTFNIISGEGSSNASVKNGEQNKDWGNWSRGDKGGFGKGNGGMQRPDKKPNMPASTMSITSLSQSVPDKTEQTSSSENASAKGIKADSSIIINGGEFTLDTSDDAVHSNNVVEINGGSFDVKSGDDGIHSDNTLTINNGTIKITKSYEGIESTNILITGGDISVTSSDDGINGAGGADGSSMNGRPGQNKFGSSSALITISGGNININASGDGIDSNGNIKVDGGCVYVSGASNNGNAALDYDGTAAITGGFFMTAGSSGMAQNFDKSTSTQGSMLVTVNQQKGGTEIILKDSSGKVLASFTPSKDYNCVLISCSELKQGASYTLICGEDSNTIKMDSLIYGEGHNSFGGRR